MSGALLASIGATVPGLRFQAQAVLGKFALDATWDVAPNETVVLVGPNGAGKSTCLAIIAGLIRPSCGHISVGSRVLCDTEQGIDLPPEQRRIGLMFQDHALFSHLDVRRNVAYGARLRHSDRRAGADAVAHWLDRLELTALADRSVETLSGGQRQRVALARTLAAEPEVLLLDEPMASFDVTARSALRLELVRFLEGVSQPTIVVTHDIVDALTFGQRVFVLEAGRVVQAGERADLLREPHSAFAAELAGLNRYVVDVPAGHGLRAAPLVADPQLLLHLIAGNDHGRMHATFSPTDVTVSLHPPAGSAQNVFAGVITSIGMLPDRLRVVMDVGVSMMADVTREAASQLGLTPGMRVWASVKALVIHVYPVHRTRVEGR